MSLLEGSWRFRYSNTPVPYGRSVVLTSRNVWMYNPSLNCLSQAGIGGNICGMRWSLTNAWLTWDMSFVHDIWTFGNIDCPKTCSVKPGLFLAPHRQHRAWLHHSEDWLWEETDGFWWWFLRRRTEKLKYEREIQSPTGWNMEKYGGKAQMLWRKERTAFGNNRHLESAWKLRVTELRNPSNRRFGLCLPTMVNNEGNRD